MVNKVGEGHKIDVVLSANTAPGAVVVVADTAGVCTAGGVTGQTVSLALQGAYALPKATGGGSGIAQGVKVYVAAGLVTATSAGGVEIGKVYKASLDADATVQVMLLK